MSCETFPLQKRQCRLERCQISWLTTRLWLYINLPTRGCKIQLNGKKICTQYWH